MMLLAPTPSHLLDSDTDTRNKIDQEIAELEQRLVSLKLARNTLAPITRLHPEILQEIFSLVHSFSEHRGKTSLLLTWICHRWRELAHEASSLWSHINFQNLEWVETALSRTKNRHLEFDLDFGRWDEQDMNSLLGLCLSNLSRVKSLAMIWRYGNQGSSFPECSSEWMTPAPHLEELHFEIIYAPPNMFSGICPALQTLYLYSCNIDWNTLPVSPNIKELFFANCEPRATITTVMGILRRVRSSLEDLTFRATLDLGTVSQIDNRIRLEKLKHLCLYERDAHIMASLFNHISLPTVGDLDVELLLQDYENPRVPIIEALISARNIVEWPVDCVKIRTELGCVKINLLEDWAGKRRDKKNKTNVEITLSSILQPADLLQILEVPPLPVIETFFFMGGTDYGLDAPLLMHVGNLGSVRKLSIELSFLGGFFDFIDKEMEKFQRPETSADVPSFHNLELLEIFMIPEILPRRLAFSREDALVLQRWLEWRKRCCNGVKTLAFRELVAPPLSWLGPIFEEAVEEFRCVDISEEADDVQV